MSKYDWKDGSQLHCEACGHVNKREDWIEILFDRTMARQTGADQLEGVQNTALLICPNCKTVRAL